MKKLLLLTFVAITALISCRKKNYAHLPPSTWEQRCVYQPNMKIDTFSNINGVFYSVMNNGDDNVFLYSAIRGGNDQVSDNEYFSHIWFPVAPELTSFSYTDAQLAEHRCYYTGEGAWGGYGFEALDKGSISGTKNPDGSWEVSIDITLKKQEPALVTSRLVLKGTFHEGNYY